MPSTRTITRPTIKEGMQMQHQSCLRMWVRLVGFILGGMLLPSLAAAQPMSPQAAPPLAPGTFRLTVTKHKVSLEAQEASVAAILADIGQRTGIPVVVYPGADARVTIHLSRVPLDEALKRLAPNIVILPAQGVNAPPHRIAKVYVLATGQARPPHCSSLTAELSLSHESVQGVGDRSHAGGTASEIA
jgi:hypothetical protein